MLSQIGHLARSLRRSQRFRKNTGNSLSGVLDYLIPGLAMLAAASFLVRQFGLSQYGLWMLATAVVGSMESLSSGFGDATVRFVSMYRGRDDREGVSRIICATLTINWALGLFLALGVVIGAKSAVTYKLRIIYLMSNRL